MKFIYYIEENVLTTNKEGLKPGPMITKSMIALPIPEDIDGIYKTLNDLKLYSTTYKKIKENDSKRANQIIEERHIFNGTNLITIPKGQTISQHQIDLLIHSVTGRLKNGIVNGVHFYDTNKVNLLAILETNEKTNVFKAEFEFLDYKTKKWIKKNGTSTFFPKEWSIHRLFQELIYAETNAIKKSGSHSVYTSSTTNGIPIEIIKRKGVMKTIYPLI
jgi:hypothetical protein